MFTRSNHWIWKAAVLAAVFYLGSVTWVAQAQSPYSSLPPDQAAEQREDKVRVIGSPEPLTYTLGPDDSIAIYVRQHPEFSGTYTVGRDGKIQYRFVGDISVQGMTKGQLAVHLTQLLSKFVVGPEVDVTITDFRSKVIYVVGELGKPARYFMRGESIPIREVVFEAGLPTEASSMRRSMIIHPPATEGENKGKVITEKVNLYALLYLGDVSKNVSLHSGDILYVPATVFHKTSRVLSPLLDPVSKAARAGDFVNDVTDD